MDGIVSSLMDNAMVASSHGRAALLLIESLIHSLVDKGVITRGEAIDVIDIASDVEAELIGAAEGETEHMLLPPLAQTFRLE